MDSTISLKIIMEAIKKVRKVCMLASGTLGIFSGVHVSFAPISAALGLTYNAICELGINFDKLEKEFQLNVEETLKQLKESLPHSKSEIVQEISEQSIDRINSIINDLSEYVYVPNELEELIEKSENYQKNYCTQKDVNEIIKLFDRYFIINMTNKIELCRFYSLCNHEITINNLNNISKILQNVNKNTDTIQQEIGRVERSVNKTSKIIQLIISKMKSFLNGLSYVLIQTGIFLIWSLLFFQETSVNTLTTVLISFATTLFFSCFISFNQFHSILISLLVTWTSKSLISIASFLIISLLTSNIGDTPYYLQLIGILLGELYGVLIKTVERNIIVS